LSRGRWSGLTANSLTKGKESMRRGIFSMLEIVSREMRRAVYARIALAGLAAVSVNSATSMAAQNPSSDVAAWQPGRTIVNPVVHQDRSPPLPSLCAVYQARPRPPHGPRPSGAEQAEKPAPIPAVTIGAQGTAVEQVSQGTRPAATLVTSFNGLGVGFTGPQSTADARNPSDDSLAVGPDKIVQVVNCVWRSIRRKARATQQTAPSSSVRSLPTPCSPASGVHAKR